MSSKRHQDYLRTHCRACSKGLGKTRYSCSKYATFLVHLGINSATDDNAVHPEFFCNNCYLIAKNIAVSGEKNLAQTPVEWLPHDDNLCTVCDIQCKGGRPKRKNSRGRPSYVQQHIKSVAAKQIPRFSLSQLASESEKYIEDVTCASCGSAANNPVEILPCKKLYCSSCCILLASKASFNCPGCSDHHKSNSDTFTQPSCIVQKMFREMKVICEKCKCTIELQLLEKECNCHEQSQSEPTEPTSLSETTPTSLDKQKAVKIVSRMLRESETGTLTVPTGGRPISIMKVTNSTVPTTDASKDTKRRRSQELAKIRDRVSIGGSEQQLVDEVKILPEESREGLMKAMNFTVHITPEQNLAMKADLCLPWKKLRIMRRWMKSWNISIASEKKQRDLMKDDLQQLEIRAESIPFSFNTRRTGQEIRPAPIACIADLKSVIFHLLDEKDRLKQLTWHEGLIPENEIWLKLGGDKGGSSVKASFQIMNVDKPNSVRNSCVFAVFEAPDSVFNLHLALDWYRTCITELQQSKWRNYNIRVFMSGDYEFLCSIYGISGASGRHCCLWCNITSDQLKISRSMRRDDDKVHITQRSLQTLSEKHSAFVQSGADLKKAKLYDNVIGEAFFEIPLTQVCPPGLHITLGVFLRLFNLLEEECHLLDLSINHPCDSSSNTYKSYLEAKSAVQSLNDERTSLSAELHQAQQVLVLLLVSVANPEQDRRVQEVATMMQNNSKRIEEIDKLITQHSSVIKKGFDREDGIFVRALDQALASFHVERQAYHGGSFIGNHVHRTLQPKNIQTLCKSVIVTAASLSNSVELQQKANEICDKFIDAFTLFKDCHAIYDSSTLLSDQTIKQLEISIDTFLQHYRVNFPSATFLPKMHMMEDHLVPWMKTWRVGCGCMGEQGAESLHSSFNNTERMYNNMKDRVERLRVVLQNHHFRILPTNEALEPPPLKKKKAEKADTTTDGQGTL